MPPDRARPPAEILYPVVQNATKNPDCLYLTGNSFSFVRGEEWVAVNCVLLFVFFILYQLFVITLHL